MKIRDAEKILQAKIICGERFLDKEIEYAFSSDLMSDVLTIDKGRVALLTGLATIQTIRTAEMAMINVIIIVRDKKVSPEMTALADENDIVLMQFKGSMFAASGILYKAGLKPVY